MVGNLLKSRTAFPQCDPHDDTTSRAPQENSGHNAYVVSSEKFIMYISILKALSSSAVDKQLNFNSV